MNEAKDFILTGDAMQFITELHKRFDADRKMLLEKRDEDQMRLDSGVDPTFLDNTAHIRCSEWKVGPIPEDLMDRRVEITGPVDRKMIINALNSGAKVFMADLEDSNSPTWDNVIEGQKNLYDGVRKEISFINPVNGKNYSLNDETATLMVRPRGLHLEEFGIEFKGKPASGSLIDFGLYFFHNAKELLKRGSGPYFYLPKLEHYREARWWNEVFVFAQEYMGIPVGTIRATVLIETILASFQLDEILYELREHSAGLNCGRWDYIFSFIKRFRNRPNYIFPDRDLLTMEVPFMKAYSQKVIQVCHKRGIHAMGGMAAQIPVKNNPAENDMAMEKVRRDKLREVHDGHDGTWVAHPALVQVAMDIFNEHMPEPNQIETRTPEGIIRAEELIAVPQGAITEAGVRKNINVGIQYLAAWLSGNGAAAIHNLMEDAATAEISRAQLWQWLKRRAELSDGSRLDEYYFDKLYTQEVQKLRIERAMNPAWKPKLELAADKYHELITAEDLDEFLTTESLDLL
ncbi:MAG: malate synthase A [Flavobacteriales bacterium]|nr:malate synthase A [Flavobacteriales bacterium]